MRLQKLANSVCRAEDPRTVQLRWRPPVRSQGKHPEARTWRGVTIPLYNEWYEIFEGTKADGSRQHNTLPRAETIEHGDPYMTPPHQTHMDLTKDDDSVASSPDFKLIENKKGKDSITPNEKRKRRRSKEPSSSFAEAMVEATKEFKKSLMPASYDMIQQCVEIIMEMDLTISEKARAADLIRKDNAYLVDGFR
ncbi:hypothetical protein Taro_052101 [Colocasia esculenta]|uniref:Uncharacterized protein n=1 Tax=Colocasia esculenta TaxID=4460 RepID=A0A843XIQ7_COLES|nr:hypothetical protein [Colocasia esculenta]